MNNNILPKPRMQQNKPLNLIAEKNFDRGPSFLGHGPSSGVFVFKNYEPAVRVLTLIDSKKFQVTKSKSGQDYTVKSLLTRQDSKRIQAEILYFPEACVKDMAHYDGMKLIFVERVDVIDPRTMRLYSDKTLWVPNDELWRARLEFLYDCSPPKDLN